MKNKRKPGESLEDFFARMGKLGGSKGKGASQRRSRAHYQRMAAASAAARRKKKLGNRGRDADNGGGNRND